MFESSMQASNGTILDGQWMSFLAAWGNKELKQVIHTVLETHLV
jgi:hypothetical protein